jgi:hypothetical protein
MSGTHDSVSTSSDTSVHSSVLGLVLRVFWMFLGSAGLAVSGLYIVIHAMAPGCSRCPMSSTGRSFC